MPVPIAAAPVAQTVVGGGVAPAGSNFTPAGQGAKRKRAGGTAKVTGQPSSTRTGAKQQQPKAVPAEQALTTIIEAFGSDYGKPILAADGSVYMERTTGSGSTAGGRLQLQYVKVGTIDRAAGTMQVSQAAAQILQEKANAAGGGRKLVKVGDDWMWQTFRKGEDGKVVADVELATEDEVKAYAAKQAQAEAQDAAKSKLQNTADWQSKLSQVGGMLGLVGGTGSFVSQLATGPDAQTGRPGAGWLTGWYTLTRLNGQAEGKLLPEWLQKGPIYTALDLGIQAYSMLEIGRDVSTISRYLSKTPLPPVNPNMVADAVAKGIHPAEAAAMLENATAVRTQQLRLDPSYSVYADMNKLDRFGQPERVLVPTDKLHKAMELSDPVTDSGLKAQAAVDRGVMKAGSAASQFIRPAMIIASVAGLAASALGIKNVVAQHGKSALIDTKQGRGMAMGVVTSGSMLAQQIAPMVLPALGVGGAALGAAGAALSITTTVLGGVQMLNQYGLFGEGGFLDNDAARAAFLVPPLSPIGLFAFYMKKRKAKQQAELAKLEQAKQVAVQRIAAQRAQVTAQLQKSGAITGGKVGADGAVTVATSIPTDLRRLASTIGRGAASQAPPAS